MIKAKKNVEFIFFLLIIFFLILPIIVIFPVSFNSNSLVNFPVNNWSLKNYISFFKDPRIWNSILLSLKIACFSTLIAEIVSFFGAVGIVKGNLFFKKTLINLFLGPLIIPAVTIGVSFLIFSVWIGYVSSMLVLILAHSIIVMPYIFRILIASLKKFDVSIEEAAVVLGGSRESILFKVILPDLIPALLSGGLLSFLVSMDEYTVTAFLVQTDNITLPIRIYQFVSLDVNPIVSAISVVLTISSIILIILIEKIKFL